jgi:hypothetical protein
MVEEQSQQLTVIRVGKLQIRQFVSREPPDLVVLVKLRFAGVPVHSRTDQTENGTSPPSSPLAKTSRLATSRQSRPRT